MDENERQRILDWFDANRRHTADLFASIRPEAYYLRPIPLRQPIIFYEGHFAAFNHMTLVLRALGKEPFAPDLDELFERGIDPETPEEAKQADAKWPDRETVRNYVSRSDAAVRHALERDVLVDDGNPLLVGAQAVYTILEHEPMHHETLRYMLHRLPHDMKIAPPQLRVEQGSEPPARATVVVPAGRVTLGAPVDQSTFAWDNELGQTEVDVAELEVDVYNVTNRDFLEFIEDGGYRRRELWDDESWEWLQDSGTHHPMFWERRNDRWEWRGMYDFYELPPAWPVYVTHAEASAWAAWKGRRLLTEPELHRVAYGQPDGGERLQPWGDAPPDHTRGNFDFLSPEPFPVGSFPAGRSAWGIHDLVGNGWEWTATPFGPFPGFREMASYPPYSSDFFDDKHFVLKGASPATSRTLVRRTFRNWFRATYPYMYATFRTVK